LDSYAISAGDVETLPKIIQDAKRGGGLKIRSPLERPLRDPSKLAAGSSISRVARAVLADNS